jgi:hypothetical protein
MACCIFFARCAQRKEKTVPGIVRIISASADYRKIDANNRVFFADLSKPSGEYRFFIVNMDDSTVVDKGLCCNGKTDSNGKVLFSNVPGSGCSSKGVYRIGRPYIGNFGKAYRLFGLNATNSNAFTRNIVLHAYKGIPPHPNGKPICKSEGCPTVNPEFLEELSRIIDGSVKPTLLFIN